MILIFQNNKLIGIDKELLTSLNTDLATLNNIISPIELNISSLKNENINILSKDFEISEKPILAVENIKVFELIPTSSEKPAQTSLPETTSLEKELFSENILSELAKESESNEPETNLENELLNITPIEKSAIEKSAEEKIEPALNENLIPKEKENEEITISFNDEYDEINSILALDKEKAKELIEKDLQKASKDLGIDIKTLDNLFKTLLDQIEENKSVFKEAIKQRNYDKLHKTAHLLKGAALNLRLSNIALILKTIDEESKKGAPIEKIEFLIDKFYTFIEKIKDKENNQNHTEAQINIQISEPIKNLIIQTIKNYLATQNEKKFKKDLKYIEKLLNIQINSIEELENLIKANQ